MRLLFLYHFLTTVACVQFDAAERSAQYLLQCQAKGLFSSNQALCGIIMGNCASGNKKEKKKGNSGPDNRRTDDKLNDDVMYASINLENAKASRQARDTADDDCDYATVNIPAALQPQPESECSSKDECTDDYVLMG